MNYTLRINHKSIKSLLMGSCTIAMISGTPLSSLAQDAAANERRQLDEIIVTAERKSSNLQDVAIAVTAVNGETLDRAGISNPLELSVNVPGFTFAPFGAGQSIFSLRGISSNDDGAGTENSVAVFLDDIYFGRVSNSAFEFFDVEQIEVLRGPQGTQFGRNAIGGAINITSTKPSLDGVKAKARATIGRFSQQELGGYVTGPILPDVAAKISFATRSRDGVQTNILTGNDTKDFDSESFRAQLLWAPTDSTEVTLTAGISDEEGGDNGRIPLGTAGVRPFFDGAGGSIEDRISTNPQEGFSDRSADIFSLKIDHQLENGGRIKSITGYYETRADWEFDSAGVPEVNVVDDILDGTDAFTQEFQYSHNITDNIDLLAGLFYLNEQTDRSEFFRFVNFFGTGVDDRSPVRPAGDPDDAIGGYRQINETNSIAGFFHANWQFTDTLSLTAGARLTHDDKTIVSSGFASGEDPTTPGLPGFIINESFGNIDTGAGIEASESFTDFSPKISLNWTPTDDLLIYGGYSRGYKAGGFGAAPPNETAATEIGIDPETANSYEVGFKGQFFENTVRLNAAAFYLDYQDLQLQRFGPSLIADADAADGFTLDPTSFGFFSTINAGDADVYGFEGEFDWLLTENLTLSGTYAFLDTEANINFREFFTDDPGQDFVIQEELNRAPRHKVSLDAQYEQPLGDKGSLLLNGSYQYSSERRADFVDNDTIEGAYDLFNASVSWITPEEDWEFQLWGKNLTDERYFQHVYVIGPGQIGTLADPATYGATIQWNFD